MFGLDDRMIIFCVIVIAIVPVSMLVKEQLKKLFARLKKQEISVIRYEDIENPPERISYSDREFFEIREIHDDGNTINFIPRHYKKVLINFLTGTMLLIPVLVALLWWKGSGTNVDNGRLISIGMAITAVFVTVSLLSGFLKYIFCESLVIKTDTGSCIRKKFGKSTEFPFNNIKNILVVREKKSSKVNLDIFFEVSNLKAIKITSIGKYNFLNMHGDNQENALALAASLAGRLKKDIVIKN